MTLFPVRSYGFPAIAEPSCSTVQFAWNDVIMLTATDFQYSTVAVTVAPCYDFAENNAACPMLLCWVLICKRIQDKRH